MTTHVLRDANDTQWTIDSSNDEWIVARGARLSVRDQYAVFGDDAYFQSHVDVLVVLRLKGSAGYSVLRLEGDGSSVDVGVSGRVVTGANTAIEVRGEFCDVVNEGLVESGSNGIFLQGDKGHGINEGTIRAYTGTWIQGLNSSFENRGTIDADRTGVFAQQDGQSIVNQRNARIIGSEQGIALNAADGTEIVNKGVIRADVALQDDFSDARFFNAGLVRGDLALGGGIDTVVNRGQIHGDIDLGSENDVIEFRAGLFDGVVNGGIGHDTYRLFKGEVAIEEEALGGTDTVESAIDCLLADNVENLTLLGGRSIKGTGNDLQNLIVGNTGDNRLSGGLGIDTLNGREGDDVLRGGQGGDKFVFATGHGNDIVADFQNGVDQIVISTWSGIADYADLIQNHLTVDGADIVLADGSDTLRLKGVDFAQIDATDFAI